MLIMNNNPTNEIENTDDWFHGIEHMTATHNGLILWKKVIIRGYNFRDLKEENAAVKEVHFRCLHIQSLGLKPNAHNCNLYWKEYENLKPDSADTAYPWVIDYYYANENKWKEIDEHHYDWYLECVPPIAMSSSSFLNGEPYTHTNERKGVYLACKYQNGKYYAQLMTLNEYKSKIHQNR